MALSYRDGELQVDDVAARREATDRRCTCTAGARWQRPRELAQALSEVAPLICSQSSPTRTGA